MYVKNNLRQMCGNTPKRRLSYTSNSTPTSTNEQQTTPLNIKRAKQGDVWKNSPVYFPSTVENDENYSPRHLNESFETLQISENHHHHQQQHQKCTTLTTTNKRILVSKYKSAPPIEMLNFDLPQQPLGDISNFDTLWSSTMITSTSSTTTTNTALVEYDSHGTKLIGDCSKDHLLPYKRTIKHNDLYSINGETLVDVLDGKYDEHIEKLIIVDARYPYEYEGGHIRNAKNIYTKELLLNELFNQQIYSGTNDKRVIIVFHCEFSSERGPSLLRFLRNQDRSMNEHFYPKLYYPELYLLEGGYKAFFERHMTHCDPQTYKPMLDAEHVKDLKHFRSKAKSWEAQKHQTCVTASMHKLSASSLRVLFKQPVIPHSPVNDDSII